MLLWEKLETKPRTKPRHNIIYYICIVNNVSIANVRRRKALARLGSMKLVLALPMRIGVLVLLARNNSDSESTNKAVGNNSNEQG